MLLFYRYIIFSCLLIASNPLYSCEMEKPEQPLPRLPKEVMTSIMHFLSTDDKAVIYLMRLFLDDTIAENIARKVVHKYKQKYKYYPPLHDYPALIDKHFTTSHNNDFKKIMSKAFNTFINEYRLYYDLCQEDIQQFNQHLQEDREWANLEKFISKQPEQAVKMLESEKTDKALIREQLKKYYVIFAECFNVAGRHIAFAQGEMRRTPELIVQPKNKPPLILFLGILAIELIISVPLLKEILLFNKINKKLLTFWTSIWVGYFCIEYYYLTKHRPTVQQWSQLRNSFLQDLCDKVRALIKQLEVQPK